MTTPLTTEQTLKLMESLGIPPKKWKYESVADDRLSVSYTLDGSKYLLTIQPYPYSR